jgi:hypothetical protein
MGRRASLCRICPPRLFVGTDSVKALTMAVVTYSTVKMSWGPAWQREPLGANRRNDPRVRRVDKAHALA